MNDHFNYNTTSSVELAKQLGIDLHTLNNNLYVKLGNNYYPEDHEKLLKEVFTMTSKAQSLVMQIIRGEI
jgi:hypothetical protein